ncbi:MAG: 3'(2'),5'-bisphosphate nucleotidase CysQ [Bacteroidales bacterium]|nr:3'(2'),5'-bisphosphate nucleotidase CysQ [Bacteroidales bacterium]
MENKDDIYLSIKAALAAGSVIREIYEKPISEYEIEKKADNSPLTLADRKANEVITTYLEKTPYPILSEEGRSIDYETRSNWQSLWIVDPLDGTKEFIKRNGEFTVNIAWVKNQEPLIGVIYVPVTSRLYFSGLSLGAYCMEDIQDLDDFPNLDALIDKAVKLPYINNPDKFVIVASRSHTSPEVKEFIESIKMKYETIETTSIGSSLKFCLMAEGSADCYPRLAPTMEWDTAAGHAIALAAGMHVVQYDTESPLIYNKPNLLNPFFVVKNSKEL